MELGLDSTYRVEWGGVEAGKVVTVPAHAAAVWSKGSKK